MDGTSVTPRAISEVKSVQWKEEENARIIPVRLLNRIARHFPTYIFCRCVLFLISVVSAALWRLVYTAAGRPCRSCCTPAACVLLRRCDHCRNANPGLGNQRVVGVTSRRIPSMCTSECICHQHHLRSPSHRPTASTAQHSSECPSRQQCVCGNRTRLGNKIVQCTSRRRRGSHETEQKRTHAATMHRMAIRITSRCDL